MKQWKEEEHPRNKIGRFTSRDGVGSIVPGKGEVDERFKLELDYFGKNQPKKESDNRQKTEIPLLPQEAYGFENHRLYTAHHQRHVSEMGFKDSKEYEKAAIDFWNSGEGNVYYSKATNNFYKYNHLTDEFMSVGTDGTVKTYYFMSQKDFERKVYRDKLYGV